MKNTILETAVKVGERALPNHPYVMDLRETFLAADSSKLLEMACELWSQLRDLDVKILYSKGIGSLPLVVLLRHAAKLDGFEVKALFVRDSRKDRNLQRLVEGPIPKDVEVNSNAVFVDDVFNTGTTLRAASKAIAAEGYSLNHVGVACVVDLWSASRVQQVLGYRVARIVRRHDLGLTRKDSKDPLVRSPIPKWIVSSFHSFNVMPYKSPPCIAFDKLFIGGDDTTLYCFDPNNGDLLWKHASENPQPKGCCCVIAQDEDSIYWTGYDGVLRKADAQTGQIRWATKLDVAVHSSPCLSADKSRVFVGTEYDKHKMGDNWNGLGDVVCIDTSTGYTNWRVRTGEMMPGSLVYNEIHDVVAGGSNDCHVYVIDASSGEVKFKIPTKGEVKGIPSFTDDGLHLVTISIHGWCQKFSILTGECVFSTRIGTRSEHPVPIITNGLIITCSKEQLVVAIDLETGKFVYTTRIRGYVTWSPVIYKDELLLVTNEGYVATLDILTGTKTSCLKINDTFKYKKLDTCTPPAIYKDTMIIASNNHGIMCYELDR